MARRPVMARPGVLAVFLALLGACACADRPAPGWKVVGPNQFVRGSRGGMIALRDEAGELVLARSATEALGEVPEFDSATAWQGGWLLTRFGTEGELGRGTQNWFRRPDGTVVELERNLEGAAVGSDGIYLLQRSCNFHRQTGATTQITFARDLESDAEVVAGPWEWLCARSIGIDDEGRIWLVGSVHGITADLSDAVLIVEQGRPRIVHQVRAHDDFMFQSRTQLAIVDDVLYLSSPRDRASEVSYGAPWRGILRLVPTAEGLREEEVVPGNLRVRRTRSRPSPFDQARDHLGSMGVHVQEGQYDQARLVDQNRFDILPYHQPLDAIVDRLVEVVRPEDTVALTALDADGCPESAALGRLPAGVVIEFVGITEDGCVDEFHRRFEHLRRPGFSR
jgi:hypothetical protein